MAKQKTTQTEASVDAFIAAIPDPSRQADCTAIIDMMKGVTRQEPAMWGSTMIGFGKYHYRYASGHEGDSFILGFASRKDAMVLYGCGGEAHTERLRNLGKHKTGKGCLYIRRLDDVDRSVLLGIMKAAVRDNAKDDAQETA